MQQKLERRVGLPAREQRLLICAHAEASGRLRYSLLPAAANSEGTAAAAAASDTVDAVPRVRDILRWPDASRAVLALADAADVRRCGAYGAAAGGDSGTGADEVLLAPFFGVYVNVVEGRTLWLAPPVHCSASPDSP